MFMLVLTCVFQLRDPLRHVRHFGAVRLARSCQTKRRSCCPAWLLRHGSFLATARSSGNLSTHGHMLRCLHSLFSALAVSPTK